MTRFFRLVFPLHVFMIVTSQQACAQNLKFTLEEDRFVNLYSKITSFNAGESDSISLYSGIFQREFTSFIKNNPATITYPFERLLDSIFCFVKTSRDGNFRIYSWDTWSGGTMRFYQEIYQWRANGKVFIKVPNHEDAETGGFVSTIFSVNILGRPYYLPVTNAKFSTSELMQSISAYTIQGHKLVDTVKVFQTRSQRLNRIDVPFDFFSVVDRPERPLELIGYDDKKNIIYIPVVDERGQVSKRNILYQLNAGYFKYIGIETGKRN